MSRHPRARHRGPHGRRTATRAALAALAVLILVAGGIALLRAGGGSGGGGHAAAGPPSRPPGVPEATGGSRAQEGGTPPQPPASTATASAAATTARTPSAGASSRGPAASTRPPATTRAAGGPSATAAPAGATAAENQVLTLVNRERAGAGCAPLRADGALGSLARAHSADMAERGYFSHTTPEGLSPWDRAAAAGVTNLGAENIARGQSTPESVMAAWMNSPGHRANILDCGLRTLGVGMRAGSGGPWWTQAFGR